MNYLLSLAAVCLLSVQSYALELPYNNLKKSYETEYSKTLDRAERWMKLLPNNPAAYYYASLIYFENAQKETVIRKRYLGLVKSLRFAKELEDIQDEEFLDLVAWDTLTPFIQSFTVNVSEELKEEELDKLSAIVDRRAKKFDWMEATSEDDEIANYESSEATHEVVSISGMRDGMYFGIPSGTEIIQSYNLQSEKEMLQHINKERLAQGMQPLVWNDDLAKASRYHAFDMGTQEYFDHDSHDRADGELKLVAGTFARIGTFYDATFVNSENIAAGNAGAQSTYMQWYNSPGHYANMFNEASGKIGIGVVLVPGSSYEYYWVMCTAY